jgi:hypothetical protein
MASAILDEQEFTISVVAGAGCKEILMGAPWLRVKRLVVDLPAGVVTLGQE